MAFQIPTLDESHAFGLDLARRLMPEMDTSEGSMLWTLLRCIAGMTTDNHAHTDSALNDGMPDTATGDSADRWGGFRGAIRKTATPAGRANALRFIGVPNTPIPDATPLVHKPSGLQFRTVGATAIGSLGSVDASVIAIDVGSKTRLGAGEILSLQQAISGVQGDAKLQLPLDQGGDDAELDDDYRPRYLEFWKNPILGGTANDYEKLVRAQEGVARAHCYPDRLGAGTVDLAALHAGSGAFRVLTAAETAALQATMRAKRPAGMLQIRVLQTVAQIVNVEVTYIDDGSLASAPDWDDRAAPTCAAWDPVTRTLRFAGGSRPPGLRPNSRITISDGATGRERVVESVPDTSPDTVVLMFDPTGDTPAVNSIIYAGGPVIEPARRAIQAVFDSLGTANPDARRYGAWEGNLRPTAISRAVTSVSGVQDIGSLISPSATVAARDPFDNLNDNTIGLLIAGRILVRRAPR